MAETDCVICMESVKDPYVIQCGSETPHIICNPCELQWRLKSKATPEGRTITCPLCRAVETDTSKRSTESLQAELSHVYFELATKNGKSTQINQTICDYIRLLEAVARVPNIPLDGLMRVPEPVATVPISRRERVQVEMEARVVRAVITRQEEANQREAVRAAQLLERQTRAAQEAAARQERAAQEAAAREARAAQAAAARQARREAARNQPDAVWCESGNIALGLCATSRKTTRQCSFQGCTKRVCFRCGQCASH